MPGAPCVRPAATAHAERTGGGCASLLERRREQRRRPATSRFGEEAAARATPKTVADARRAGNVLAACWLRRAAMTATVRRA
eukprot:scaffold81599_cov85-Phaeocystis_antarctica.AAC.2